MQRALRCTARLRLLQEHDQERHWNSIEDERVCLLCGSEFSGNDISIKAMGGKPLFRCPTTSCRGSLKHFARPGNPLLSEETWMDWMRTPGMTSEA